MRTMDGLSRTDTSRSSTTVVSDAEREESGAQMDRRDGRAAEVREQVSAGDGGGVNKAVAVIAASLCVEADAEPEQSRCSERRADSDVSRDEEKRPTAGNAAVRRRAVGTKEESMVTIV